MPSSWKKAAPLSKGAEEFAQQQIANFAVVTRRPFKQHDSLGRVALHVEMAQSPSTVQRGQKDRDDFLPFRVVTWPAVLHALALFHAPALRDQNGGPRNA